MNSPSKIIFTVFNSLFLFWLTFALQRVLGIGVEIRFLNAGAAAVTSAILNYLIWNQQLNFNTVLKYALIFWGIGFVSGIVFVSIFDPNDGQGIFLAILWTGPIGWLLGLLISVIIEKMSLSRNIKNDLQ